MKHLCDDKSLNRVALHVVETDDARCTLSLVEPLDGGFNVWLGLDHDSLPEFIIGTGATKDEAIRNSVLMLERLTDAIQNGVLWRK